VVRQRIIRLALDAPALSPRELAVRFTDTERYFVSEASVYRLLKAQTWLDSVNKINCLRNQAAGVSKIWLIKPRRPENSRRIASRLALIRFSIVSGQHPLVKREHREPHTYGPCHEPAGAVAIVAVQAIHPKEQSLGLRRLRDPERSSAQHLPQLALKRPPLAARHPGNAPNRVDGKNHVMNVFLISGSLAMTLGDP